MVTAVARRYDFREAIGAWGRVPLDELGYMPSWDLCGWPDEALRVVSEYVRLVRYDPTGWRNVGGTWREVMGYESCQGKRVLDFGCGAGIEAIEYAKAEAKVAVVDINPHNVLLAMRMLLSRGHTPWFIGTANDAPSYFSVPEPMDVFASAGVLHHTPHIRGILQTAVANLAPGGECRLLLYSDRRWTALGLDPDPDEDVSAHPRFLEYVRSCDEVGHYADWYNAEKLQRVVDGFGVVQSWRYVGRGEEFLGAVVVGA